MDKIDFVVSAQVSFKDFIASIFKQIGKIFRVVISIIKYDRGEFRNKYARGRVWKKFVKSFNSADIVASTGTYQLVRSFNKPEHMAGFLDDYVNCGMKDFREGEKVGSLLLNTHPTLQGSVIRFALGIIIAFSKKNGYTDARNETPVAMAKKIAKLVEDDELRMGYMI
jgi:hypothetical protein